MDMSRNRYTCSRQSVNEEETHGDGRNGGDMAAVTMEAIEESSKWHLDRPPHNFLDLMIMTTTTMMLMETM